jgi:lysozyme
MFEYFKCQKTGESKMNISGEGLSLLKKFEGCELRSYRCSAGVLTIGYGHTKGVTEGMEIDQDEAERMLASEMSEYEGNITDNVEVPLSQNQFDSLVCWVYNLGVGNLRSSTLLAVLNKGEYDEVPTQMKRWNKAGGQVLNGLIRRREAEAAMFEGKGWSHI